MNHSLQKNALLWRSRRGMKETEGLLLPFIESQYERLTESEKALYARLMDESDPDLLNWLLYHLPSPAEYAALVRRIQQKN